MSDDKLTPVLLAAAGLMAVWAWWEWRQDQIPDDDGAAVAPWWQVFASAGDVVLDAVDDASFSLVGYRVSGSDRWAQAAAKPANADYVAAAHEAEARIGAPLNLIVRQIYQESRFDPQAFNRFSGASGIMQIVPKWHPGVDVWDPFASIDYGSRYLRQQFDRFGSWELALKAYNWGPANVAAWLKGQKQQPLETANYSRQILADIGIAPTYA